MAANRPTSPSQPVFDASEVAHAAAVPSFAELGLPAVLCRALADQGITAPFPIQAATMRDAAAGRDVLGRGRTGSGKTLAFVLPVLMRLAESNVPRKSGRPRALILAPTRELASQIHAAMAPLAQRLSLRTTTVFGGVAAGPQISALRQGIDVLVACPGRLGDHIDSRHASLDSVEITVIDEADHMADLGFLPVVKRLLDQTPRNGQRMLFSATLDAGVDVIVRKYLTDPVTHSVDSDKSENAEMVHHVLHVTNADRVPVLVDLTSAPGRTMVFTRTKHRAKQLTRQLIAAGVPAVEMHGNLAQGARTRNLAAFSDGKANTMVATDIAARGIHVDDVTLVVHADPPVEHKAYLHRSGRTARAGNSGTVVTLMTDEQVSAVRDLTRKAGIKPTTTRLGLGHPLLVELAPGQRSLVPVGQRVAPVSSPEPMAPGPRRLRTAGTNSNGPRGGTGSGGARPGARNGRRPGSSAGGGGAGSRSSAAGGGRDGRRRSA
jgi:superfamily II DNA/RNA helicase